MKYKMIIGLLAILALIVAVGCTSSQPQGQDVPLQDTAGQEETAVQENSAVQQSEGTQVVIDNFAFKPSTIEVKQGDTIEWVNKDSAPHTVTFDNGMADENLPSGGTARVTFTEAGQFTYFCSFHPEMKGIVIVQ